jgi:hypothetical protein
MKIREALNNEIFDFPLRPASYFPEYIYNTISKYINLLESIDDEYQGLILKNLDNIKKSCLATIEITDSVFKGNTANAYSQFSTLIENLEQYLLYPNNNVIKQNPSYLFKARRYMENDFNLTDMFHVPFEKRYTINSSRFSLPGVPCLYLSNSIYTCWEELDRPSFSQMAVSRYEMKGKNFKFLDLDNKIVFLRSSFSIRNKENKSQIPEEQIVSLEKLFIYGLTRFINSYPLVCACYVKVFNKGAHFKPEYIFPQMLMQWIMTKEDIDGIKYFSTKVNQSSYSLHNLEGFTNFAIPVRSVEKSGHCKILSKSFGLTEPITWDLLNIIDPLQISNKINVEDKLPVPPILQFKLINEKPIYYPNTAFGKLEHELFLMPIKDLISS